MDITFYFTHYFFIAVHGMWGIWKAFGACSTTCGPGITSRTRNCDNPPPAHGGNVCAGKNTEKKACEDAPCASKYIRVVFF